MNDAYLADLIAWKLEGEHDRISLAPDVRMTCIEHGIDPQHLGHRAAEIWLEVGILYDARCRKILQAILDGISISDAIDDLRAKYPRSPRVSVSVYVET